MIHQRVQRFYHPEAKYSIIIPSWNNLAYLQLAIRSIKQHSHFKHQIIVFINEGSDGSYQWIEQQTDIDYLYAPVNIGICYALNASRSLIQTDYLVYMNDDMYVLPNWDLVLDQEISQLGSKRFFLSLTLIEPTLVSNCAIVADFGQQIEQFDEQGLLENYQRFDKPDWSGSTWPINIIHVNEWDLVGGYSIEFSPGLYSDPDFSRKLWESGIRYFKGLGKSRAYHFGSKSVGRSTLNNGHQMFLLKWEMSSKLFTTFYLKRGQNFEGELLTPSLNSIKQFLITIKYLIAAIRRCLLK